MSAAFIGDCSLTMAWCFSDEATPRTSALLDRLEQEQMLVPSLWRLEVVNVLALAEKRGRITSGQAIDFLALLDALDIVADEQSGVRAFAHFPSLCRQYGLTSYDATYLDLALRTGLPLATNDERLAAAARVAGVALL